MKTKEITSARLAYNEFKNCFKDIADHEEVWVLFLNGANNVIEKKMMGMGSINEVVFNIRGIVRACLMNNATSVIVAHNHPSNHTHPSNADIKNTQTLTDACKLFNISLIDHLVIGTDNYFSFAEEKSYKMVA